MKCASVVPKFTTAPVFIWSVPPFTATVVLTVKVLLAASVPTTVNDVATPAGAAFSVTTWPALTVTVSAAAGTVPLQVVHVAGVFQLPVPVEEQFAASPAPVQASKTNAAAARNAVSA